jgi:hypothetical protein
MSVNLTKKDVSLAGGFAVAGLYFCKKERQSQQTDRDGETIRKD